MNGTQIRDLAQNLCEEETISASVAIMFINECIQMAIGKDSMYSNSAIITVTNIDTWYALPADFLEVLAIDKTGSTTPYYGSRYGTTYNSLFDLKPGYIRIPDLGEFTMLYFAVPPVITAISDTPAIHALFHYPIALFLASRFKKFDDEENEDSDVLMAEFSAYKEKAKNTLIPTLKPTTKAARVVKKTRWS